MYIRTPVAIALAALLTSAVPQDARQPEVRQPEGFVLESGEHALRDVIDRAARFLGRNYLMSAKELDAADCTIELQKKLILDAIGCEEVVSQLAYFKGFAIVPRDIERRMYEVVMLRGSRLAEIGNAAVIMSADEVLRHARLKSPVMVVVDLKHIDAGRASQQLRPFFASAGSRNLTIGSPDTRSLVLQGFADQVATAVRLIRAVDEASKSAPVSAGYVHQQIAANAKATKLNAASLKNLTNRIGLLEAAVAELKTP